MGDIVNNFLNRGQFPKGAEINDILNSFREKTQVEKLKEESFVFKELVNGVPMVRIGEKLTAKHNINVNSSDIKKFLERNQEIVKSLQLKDNNDNRRHIIARTNLEEELSGLYLFTKELLKKFDKEGDNTSTLGAIKALNMTLVNYCKLIGAGGFAPSDQQVNVEVNVGEKRNAKTLEANFSMVDSINKEIKEEKYEETISKK